MGSHSTLKRLLSAVIVAGLAGGVAFALTVWLAPASVSTSWVSIIVAAITALAVLAPSSILDSISENRDDHQSLKETYYDLDYSLKKNSGYDD